MADNSAAAKVQEHVGRLAGTIGERNTVRYQALEEARKYLTATLTGAGYTVAEQPYDAAGKRVANLIAELPGRGAAGEIVVAGAHYDSVTGAPGADDNGSGVAVLLELARRMRHEKPSRTVRFVFFTNEEPPWFKTELMGSRVYARECRRKKEKIVAMYSIETVGYFSDVKGSQNYPFPLNLRYPDTGNFLGFVANTGSAALLKRSLAAFRAATSLPTEGVAMPAILPGLDWSDHWSFWQEGYPGIMVTDTAPFRYPHYHTALDTPDKLDYRRLEEVVLGMAEVVRREAER